MKETKHKTLKLSSGWSIYPTRCGISPYPWEFIHEDYGGSEDSLLAGHGITREDCLEQILEAELELKRNHERN